MGPKVDWPLYNQPSDASVYHENKRKNIAFKRRLLEYFKKRHAEKESRNTYLTETYSKLMQEWLRKVDKIESSTKRKTKEPKNREFFEKVFPELRKQREDKERCVFFLKRQSVLYAIFAYVTSSQLKTYLIQFLSCYFHRP